MSHTISLKQMDSVIFDPKSELDRWFAFILRFYIPPPAKILDPMAGHRHMYQILLNKTLDHNDYQFTFGDIRNFKGLDYIGDARDLSRFQDNNFNGVVVDPPWCDRFGYRGEKVDFGPFTQEALESLFERGNVEWNRVLATNGRLIVRIMDRHRERKFYPNHVMTINKLTNFELYDLLVYRYFSNRPKFKLPFASTRHSYFMIFDKKGAS